MKKIAFIASLAVIGLGGAALAQEGQQAPASPTEQAAQAQSTPAEPALSEEEARMQEVQCRSERVTGSRSRVNRVCMTRAEWRALEAREGENVRELQGRGSGGYQCTRDAQGGCS